MAQPSNGTDFQEKLSLGTRLRHGWNAFRNKDPSYSVLTDPGQFDEKNESLGYTGWSGPVSYIHPDHRRYSVGTDKTIAVAIYNRIVMDCSSVHFKHVRVNENDMFVEEIKSDLNEVLQVSANKDQTSIAFVSDIVMSMLDEGYIAVVPVDTTRNPFDTNSYDIQSMRVGKIVGWKPDAVRINLYNDRSGRHEEIWMPKADVAILENPFYSVMNEQNSTLKRLTHKLALLDVMDEQNSSGKLDLIIQLPYVIKNSQKQEQAEKRRKQIEDQLTNTKYGIAYTDGTERIVQLNRAVENQLMEQIEYLTSILYGQLGINEEIMNGTASEETMQNYYKRTIDVILNAIAAEFTRKFLTKTARTQGQVVRFYRDPFSLTTTNNIAEIADKMTRNEILSPNEVRGVVGFLPSKDESANELRNRNLNQSSDGGTAPPAMAPDDGGEEESDLRSEVLSRFG